MSRTKLLLSDDEYDDWADGPICGTPDDTEYQRWIEETGLDPFEDRPCPEYDEWTDNLPDEGYYDQEPN